MHPPPPQSSSSSQNNVNMKAKSSSPPPLHPPRPPLVNRGASDGSRGSKSNNSVSFKDNVGTTQQESSQRNISIDTVVASQFENEAETHILAALEIEERDQSKLLGERIDFTGGMEDYSDDDEDENVNEGSEVDGGRPRSYSTDSFLKRVHMQNEQPQYHYEIELSPSPSSSPTTSQQHHKRFASTAKGSGFLPSVPDDTAVLFDYLERDDFDHEKDTSLLVSVVDREGEAVDSDLAGKSGSKIEGIKSTFDETANTVNTAKTTENVSLMAKRLAKLQRRGPRFSRRSLSASSSTSSSTSGYLSERRGGDNDTSHDKLIDALNSVEAAKRGWCGKICHEWNLLIVPKLPTFRKHISTVLLFLVFPSLTVASVLFYMFDNPSAGETGTSISWWIIFIGARQAITMGLAWVGQVFWVEILALRSRLFNTLVGPYVSLAIIQSSG